MASDFRNGSSPYSVPLRVYSVGRYLGGDASAVSGDVNRFAMVGEVSSLAVREALRLPRHRRFGEPKFLPGILSEPQTTKVILRKAR